LHVVSTHRAFSGERLRDRRRQARLSRTVLAFAVGRTAESIGNYERGSTVPRADVLAKLTQVLECDLDDLYEDAEAEVA
jgi:transcriptional regulator with XRE-family HTH domain